MCFRGGQTSQIQMLMLANYDIVYKSNMELKSLLLSNTECGTSIMVPMNISFLIVTREQ